MKKNHLLLKKSYHPAIIILVTCFAMFTGTSCKNKKDKTVESWPTESTFKMNCVRLTKAQVQEWVDSGWTNPANANRIKVILFQFFTLNASGANSNMQQLSYPGKSLSEIKPNGMDTLAIDTVCAAKTISGSAVLGNNMIYLSTLKIIKADGTLTDFDFVRFIPSTRFAPYLSYTVEIVRNGVAEKLTDDEGTNPCPPPQYCPPPPPES